MAYLLLLLAFVTCLLLTRDNMSLEERKLNIYIYRERERDKETETETGQRDREVLMRNGKFMETGAHGKRRERLEGVCQWRVL
jgi:hypothetical protein